MRDATPSANDAPEPVWVLTGPTASGKSGLAVELAERLDLEILSMDSMAIYRRMDIGTAKPAADERARVPHHLIDLVDPDEGFDTSRWCDAADAARAEVEARGRRVLFVGGTPLYLMAYFTGMMSGPAADDALRGRLQAREAETPGSLHRELTERDPTAAARIHPRDTKRLVRALEVLEHTGRPISEQQTSFESDAWRVPCRIATCEIETLEHEQPVHRVLQLPASGGQDRTLELHSSPLETHDGRLVGAVIVLDDVTQLRRLERVRRDFFGNVSHELKTPVTAIRGLVETLIDDPDAELDIRQRFLGKVRDQSDRLAALVTDLLSSQLIRLVVRVGVHRPKSDKRPSPQRRQ